MTPSPKTRICLALSVVLTTAACYAQTSSGVSPVTAIPTTPSSAPTTESGFVAASSRPIDSAGMAVNTPARFTEWTLLGSENDVFAELALVVPNKEIDIVTTGRMIEDLGIMSRIIEKNVLAPYGVERAGWRDVFVGADRSPQVGPRVLFPSLGRPRPLYLGGYGATFFIQVDFPLVAPANKTQEQPAQTQEDQVWAQTRQSLREPRSAGTARGDHAGQPYSQAKVESFRKALIATLKHATNIRGLEANEWLTLVVQGLGSSSANPERTMIMGTSVPGGGVTSSGRSVMTLRATKADVDAWAKGQLSPEQFEQRVQVITY
jgi:hypothetical protein